MARTRVRAASRSGGSSSTLWLGVVIIVFAGAALIALLAFYLMVPRPPVLSKEDLCPLTGPRGIAVVLVDTTDDLLPTTQKEVLTILHDLINALPAYYKLDVRVLDISNMQSRSLFSKCNPGDGSEQSELTSNPRILRQRWLESFERPALDAVNSTLAAAKSKSSPLMAAIQDIAIADFSSEAARNIPRSLVIISDMLEFTPLYGQYPRQGDLSYDRFRQSPAYGKFRTDLHGAGVTIDYVKRPSVKIDSTKHVQFWSEWIVDNRGKVDLIHELQG